MELLLKILKYVLAKYKRDVTDYEWFFAWMKMFNVITKLKNYVFGFNLTLLLPFWSGGRILYAGYLLSFYCKLG